MTEPVYFVIERTAAGETVAVYYDHLPARLSAYKQPRDGYGKPLVLRDLKGAVVDLNPMVYALRIDRLPAESEWHNAKSHVDFASLYSRHRDAGTLPPPNIADPPKAKGEQGILLGEAYRVKNPPWHFEDREQFPVALFCGDCGEVVAPGRHKRTCPEHDRQMLNRG